MDHLVPSRLSPYHVFTAAEWATFRADAPLTLTAHELDRLRSLGDMIDLDEVARIYLSISRLLHAHIEASKLLFQERQRFLRQDSQIPKAPFVIGMAGSVAVGKSTTARILQELLSRSPGSPRVDLVTTDGFLRPNAELRARDMMNRKGFPESYDAPAILDFLSRIKAGSPNVPAPVYSHFFYDVQPDQTVTVDRPDILIVEGLNVLQANEMPPDGRAIPFVSDFFDYAIYVDAEESQIRTWYIDRFMKLRETAFREPDAFFHKYSQMSDETARAIAESLWRDINAVNLRRNILPTRPRADLILHKGRNHLVDSVSLRKL